MHEAHSLYCKLPYPEYMGEMTTVWRTASLYEEGRQAELMTDALGSPFHVHEQFVSYASSEEIEASFVYQGERQPPDRVLTVAG